MKKIFPTIVISAFSISLFIFISSFISKETISDDYTGNNYLRYEDYIYVDHIKTVLLHHTGTPLSNPIIPLNGTEQLLLSFDDFKTLPRDYYYSVVHCNANWTPSDLRPNEYINGFFEDIIFDYQYSINTDIPYLHYQLQIPNENISFTKSGNYLIKVYENGKEDKPILTKRFMVYDSKVSITIDPKRATNVEHQFTKQEIDFNIDHTGYEIIDPFKDLQVVIMQNFRWDNAIYNLPPRFIKGQELVYDYETENSFYGNNEFREFDLKSIRYQTLNVERIEFNSVKKMNEAYLVTDENRSYKRYTTNPDINGNFLIKRNEGERSEVEADYVNVHFTLANVPPKDGVFYVFGKLSDWKFKDDFKMAYDSASSSYTTDVMLKQGFYNYTYCLLKDGAKTTGDMTEIEGSHSQTENDYMVLVYHRLPNRIYDELIGFQTINTKNQ
ncbi:MAG: DUF5103 domain-containing protein [Vicingaceae bacterium]|jgi:hypothetical protein|nr:DUF5103 domain-containing protein [Vicingaceae bacterium]|tara:strand:- start:223415 stop:224740 length:1326 start_codon:yes stop_codon:yes gene_type:complete